MGWAISAALALGILTGGLAVLERYIVYPFDPRIVDPAAVGLPNVAVDEFPTPDGKTAIVWHAKPKLGKPVVFYLHGNAGNLANRQARFRILSKRGYGIVAPAYPGSSGSEGWPTETTLNAVTSQVFRAMLGGTFGPSPARIVVYGESLGAAVAIKLASETDRIDAIILEAPFTSLGAVARNLDPELRRVTGTMVNIWDSLSKAPRMVEPLLVVHGQKDQLIPIDHGRAIYNAAASADKTFLPIKNAGHRDLWTTGTQALLFDWIDSRL